MTGFLRVTARGKSLYLGDRKFRVHGVTYGPFPPGPTGSPFPDRDGVERDFARMAAAGLNSVRTYTVPPRWLLDVALCHGLRVMVGVPWEQHIAFLNRRRVARRIVERIRDGVRSCAGHPAVLCFAVGNEIPASLVRWYGPRKVEQFLERLYRTAKREDPAALVTYVSYPSTEYLNPACLDIACFNVYLEDRRKLASYLARLQNLCGDRPLLMAEVGLDSQRNGEAKQAEVLDWQVRTAVEAGCTGVFLFAWSDSWHRGGHEITDWSFGLVDRDGQPKPALAAVEKAFGAPLRPGDRGWPSVSVVVCTYNGARTIRECLEGLARLRYPSALERSSFDVIVINDGSVDGTRAIVTDCAELFAARDIPFGMVEIENGGLSNARNLGMRTATGDIVAYIDDDAYPDPDWLTHLALMFSRTDHVGVGGPNIAPPGDGTIADCVANSPGGPIHVLQTDDVAEHIPGCNMAFRREALLAVDGFDTRFRIAGDDVDLCWRLLERGGTLGFSAGAVVWHHRRNSVRAYLRQQHNYGRAEGYLEEKWPQNYNRLGHLRWSGRLYGNGYSASPHPGAEHIQYGEWGTGLFQCMYSAEAGTFWSLARMPEWYLVTALIALVCALGWSWPPLFLGLPILGVAILLPLIQVAAGVRRAHFTSAESRWRRAKLVTLTTCLHVLQPLSRLLGRMRSKLTPWRRHGVEGVDFPRPRQFAHWSEGWRDIVDWLGRLEIALQAHRVPTRRGGDYDRYDLQAAGGLLGGVRMIAAIEEHGDGKQFVRVKVWPVSSWAAVLTGVLFGVLSIGAGLDSAWLASGVLATLAVAVLFQALRECGIALHATRSAIADWPAQVNDLDSSPAVAPTKSSEPS